MVYYSFLNLKIHSLEHAVSLPCTQNIQAKQCALRGDSLSPHL